MGRCPNSAYEDVSRPARRPARVSRYPVRARDAGAVWHTTAYALWALIEMVFNPGSEWKIHAFNMA